MLTVWIRDPRRRGSTNSTKYFGLKGNAGPTTLTPDIVAPLKITDILAGTDPVLDAAIRAR